MSGGRKARAGNHSAVVARRAGCEGRSSLLRSSGTVEVAPDARGEEILSCLFPVSARPGRAPNPPVAMRGTSVNAHRPPRGAADLPRSEGWGEGRGVGPGPGRQKAVPARAETMTRSLGSVRFATDAVGPCGTQAKCGWLYWTFVLRQAKQAFCALRFVNSVLLASRCVALPPKCARASRTRHSTLSSGRWASKCNGTALISFLQPVRSGVGAVRRGRRDASECVLNLGELEGDREHLSSRSLDSRFISLVILRATAVRASASAVVAVNSAILCCFLPTKLSSCS